VSHVLVPLDGSEKDERAIPAAAAIADQVEADIRLIRVLDLPIDGLSPRARVMGGADAAIEMRGDIERSVRGIADRIIADTGRPVTAEVAEGFDVAGVLVARVAEPGTELMVMATRAAGAIGRAIRGSVADRVMRESPRPVVLVPPGADELRDRPVQLKRVLVPLDTSAFALAAINELLSLRGGHALDFVLVTVVTPAAFEGPRPMLADALAYSPMPDEHTAPRDRATSRAVAEQHLNAAADRLRAQGVHVSSVHIIEDADPAVAITRAVREHMVDFVAMTTRGGSGLKRFMLGSVAERVVRGATVPVLLVTPR
jgi:nucleotide-binding universal stress UspA family protein